jgi:undecaprenyl diphosphate synthase
LKPGFHVAIIMDGNGRWASQRGLPRPFGHRAGAETLKRIASLAPDLGVTTLTLFAFSTYNWLRAPAEVTGLMNLLGDYLARETQAFVTGGWRLSLIGRRDRLPARHLADLERIEAATAGGKRLHVRIAVDYSAREAIEQAAHSHASDLARVIAQSRPGDSDEVLEVDLMIRTGGDKRLSDFLLWECAFAELYFVDTLWPDFDETCLTAAIDDFRGRERANAVAPSPRLMVS